MSENVTLARRIIELEAIAQISTAVSGILDLNDLLQYALVNTKNQFDLYLVNIALLDERGENLISFLGENDRLSIHSPVPPIPINQRPSICARVARERVPMVVNDVHTHPDFMPHPLLPETQAELCLPMVVGDELIGIIDVQARERNRFTGEDVYIYKTLAAQFAIAIQNARLFAALRDQAAHLEQEVTRRTAELRDANQQLTKEISERQQAEKSLRIYAQELERSNQELNNFASIASHDLQEPLRKIISFGNRLEEKYAGVLDERGVTYLQRMQSAAARMQRLILDILALSRVTTQRQPFIMVSLNTIVSDVLADVEVRIEQTGATIYVHDLPDIEADPTQIRQLLQNLVGNALKFSRPDVPSVIEIFSQSMESQEDATIRLFIKDNGIGIDEQFKDRIFEIFERLHTRMEYEGTGVGLAICRKIVERHNGSITLESTPGEGTTFIVTLPCHQ